MYLLLWVSFDETSFIGCLDVVVPLKGVLVDDAVAAASPLHPKVLHLMIINLII